MKPEIETYLREHGDRYTPQALREQLIAAGHSADEVDLALGQWRPTPAGPDRRFRRLTWLIHGAALLIVAGWMLLLGNGDASWIAVVAPVLAVALLIGVAVSQVLGAPLLRGTGLGVALVVPVVTALLIGGSCLGLLGAFGEVR